MTWTETPHQLNRVRVAGWLRRRLGHPEADDGSSIVEFILLAVLLIIPIIYLLLGVSAVQGASYAATGAADQAAKVYVAAESSDDPENAGSLNAAADRSSEVAVEAALADFGIDPARASVTRSCPDGGCSEDGDLVAFTVEVQVPVPLIPTFAERHPTLLTVSSTSVQVQGG